MQPLSLNTPTATPRFSSLFLMRAPIDTLSDKPVKNNQPRTAGKITIRKRLQERARTALAIGGGRALGDVALDTSPPSATVGFQSALSGAKPSPESRLKGYQLAEQLREGIPKGISYLRLILPADGVPIGFKKRLDAGTPTRRSLYLLETSGVHTDDFVENAARAVFGDKVNPTQIKATRTLLTGIFPSTDGRLTRTHVEDVKDALKGKLLGFWPAVLNLWTKLEKTQNIAPTAPRIKPHPGVLDPLQEYATKWAVLDIPPEAKEPSDWRIISPIDMGKT
jgi:hypothetical protein